MAKKSVISFPDGSPEVEQGAFQIVAPEEMVSDTPAPEVIPAPPDEKPGNHLGAWPDAVGQRVQGEAFQGIATVLRIVDGTAVVRADLDGQEYIAPAAEMGVVEG